MAYSMDLRLRVVAALERGERVSHVARRFSVSRTAARDWRDRAGEGRLEPGTPGPKDSVKLTGADDRIMREQVAWNPGITVKQLMPMLTVSVVESTVGRRLKKLGLRLKKVAGRGGTGQTRRERASQELRHRASVRGA